MDGDEHGGPSVINAGDGTHEHPTQALLDALTLRQRLGSIEGRRVVIVGDVLHSRVARSNVVLLAHAGRRGGAGRAAHAAAGRGWPSWPVTVSHDLDAELPAADAVLMLRVQAERMNGGFFPSAREYSVLYGLSEKRRPSSPSMPSCCTRADAARHGDRVLGGGFVAIGCAATGFQRSSRADGGAVPPAGRRRGTEAISA